MVKLQRWFLWGGDVDQKKIAWISWESACLSKEKEGLGIKDLTKFNRALLGERRWNLFHRHGELWARMLDSKYGGWRNLDENRRNSAEFVWWKDLSSICHSPGEESWFKARIKWSMGFGSKVRFWEEGWKDNGILLMVKFPRLYLNSNQKNHYIQQLGSNSGGEWEWSLQWRLLFEGEIPMVANFLEEIQGLNINAHQQDKWVWLSDPTGLYTVRSAYKLLDRDSRDKNIDGVFHDIWKLKITSKAVFFAWRLLRDRLATKSNLCRRNVDIIDRLCPFCREKEEEEAHLFFSFHKIMPLW